MGVKGRAPKLLLNQGPSEPCYATDSTGVVYMCVGVCRVDVAIGHRLGCFPLPLLAGNLKLVGSVALIEPIPAHKPAQ